ncbi:ubiquitin carboxyl-terminal hydrolase 21-like isoform X2 [Notolabrus celidotus]|uniref:ubiquitin carboxyl-terminal hydrolase 21-like isoform X2 n=1 Tax=Notolabrus celidotus TaxID=1203425 RepID=UPI00148FFDE1|nr:ubiquitin carboxyl-terminal hydrolase 21-like isoform X2 [Notolabrus celidotus]
MSYLFNYGRLFPNKPPSVKYKGLKNQGATCYLNSVLQVLFMTEDFREAVERYHGTECIDLQLKTLFEKLCNQNADTYDITKQLGVKRVYEQQDAAEYFEKILKRTSDEASQIFHGQLTHRTTCSGCDTQTDADGRIWHLPLTLVDYNSEYSVVNGIEEYFRALTFSGENQMYCDHCDAKQDATIKCVMKHHPEVLMLLLKRFELDYYSMTYFKNNCNVHIPRILQIPENQTYELYAVVEHVGDLRSGHYSATIKSQEDDRWYKFNDTRVTLVDFQPFQTDQSERSGLAYLLFYRKKSVPAADTSTPEVIVEESTPGGCLSSTSDDDNEGQDVIMVNGQEEVQEAADARNDDAVGGFIDPREQIGTFADRVSVSSEVEVRSPERCCDVEDQEGRVYSRKNVTYNYEEHSEERNDSLHQFQDREEDEVKTAAANEEIVGKSVEDKQAEKKEVISGESRREESVENHKIDDSKKKRQQGHIRASSYDGMSEQKALTIRERHEHPRQVCVVVQIENEEVEMDIKRDKDKQMDRNEQRERRGRGQHQVNEGLDDVGKSLKVDPERRQESGEDISSSEADKKGREKRVNEERKAASEEKMGADRVESVRRKLSTTTLDNVRVGSSTQDMAQVDQAGKRGSGSRHGGREQYKEEKMEVQKAKEQKRRDDKQLQREPSLAKTKYADKKSSDDIDHERAHPARKDVYAAEKQEEGEDCERVRDRDREVQRAKEGKRRDDQHSNKGVALITKPVGDTDKRGSDHIGRRTADPTHRVVGAEKKQEKRGDCERIQDRDSSSGLERSRSKTEHQGEVRQKQAGPKYDEGRFEMVGITLETPKETCLDRRQELAEDSGKTTSCFPISFQKGKRKLNPKELDVEFYKAKREKKASDTQEQAAGVKHETKKKWWRFSSAKKHSKGKKKWGKKFQFFTSRRQTSESD